MARKAPQKPAERVSGHPASDDLAAILTAFKSAHSEQWEQLRLCPLQHGLETMIELLK